MEERQIVHIHYLDYGNTCKTMFDKGWLVVSWKSAPESMLKGTLGNYIYVEFIKPIPGGVYSR